jgi:hypothetical protein
VITAIIIGLPDEYGEVEVKRAQVPSGDRDGLRFLQTAVGGYLEHLGVPKRNVDIWVNEEGKNVGLPMNSVATDLLWTLAPDFTGQDVLVGTVVITGHNGPETASVPEGLWEELQEMPWRAEVTWVDELVVSEEL